MSVEQQELISHVQRIGTIGIVDGVDTIVKGDDCLEALHDIFLCIRRDDPKQRYVYKQLGSWKFLSKDLLLLFITYSNDSKLTFSVSKLMYMLTSLPPKDIDPADLALEYKILQDYKEAFLAKDVIAVIMSTLEQPLSRQLQQDEDDYTYSEKQRQEDANYIELIISTFINLLKIPDPAPSSVSSDDTRESMHERLVRTFHKENVLEAITVLCQRDFLEKADKATWNLLFLEFLVYILKDETPQEIIKASTLATTTIDLVNDDNDESSSSSNNNNNNSNSNNNNNSSVSDAPHPYNASLLSELLKAEERQQKRLMADLSIRHSRFAGTIVSGSKDNRIVSSTPNIDRIKRLQSVTSKKPRFNRKRLAVKEKIRDKSSSAEVKTILKGFAQTFMESCFDTLMTSVWIRIEGKSDSLWDTDQVNFFWLAKFFLQFNRLLQEKQQKEQQQSEKTSFDITYVSSVLEESVFTFVYHLLEKYPEDKEWNHLPPVVGLLKEMLLTLELLSHDTTNEENRELSLAIQSRIFYEKSYFDQIVKLLKEFQPFRNTKSYLCELVELVHVLLRMVKEFSKARGQKIYVKTVKKKRAQRQKKSDNSEEGGNENANKPEEGQETKTAAAAAAAEGENVDDSEAEQQSTKPTPSSSCSSSKKADRRTTPINSVREDEDEEHVLEEQDQMQPEQMYEEREQVMDFYDYAAKFANRAVLTTYCYLLREYDTNPPSINHYIVKMLNRIAVDCELEPMLFQISYLKLFNDILNDKVIANDPNFRELIAFSKTTVRHFFALAKKNPKLYVEALFWKTKNMCIVLQHEAGIERKNKRKHDLEEGDDVDAVFASDDEGQSEPKVGGRWTKHEDDLLRKLYKRYKNHSARDEAIATELDTGRSGTAVAARIRKLLLDKEEDISDDDDNNNININNSDDDNDDAATKKKSAKPTKKRRVDDKPSSSSATGSSSSKATKSAAASAPAKNPQKPQQPKCSLKDALSAIRQFIALCATWKHEASSSEADEQQQQQACDKFDMNLSGLKWIAGEIHSAKLARMALDKGEAPQDYVIIPMTPQEHAYLQPDALSGCMKEFNALMDRLTFTPLRSEGQSFHRIPGYFSYKHLQRIDLAINKGIREHLDPEHELDSDDEDEDEDDLDGEEQQQQQEEREQVHHHDVDNNALMEEATDEDDDGEPKGESADAGEEEEEYQFSS